MNKLQLHLIKPATFVINHHSDLLVVTVGDGLCRRSTEPAHTYVRLYRRGEVILVLYLFTLMWRFSAPLKNDTYFRRALNNKSLFQWNNFLAKILY